MIDFDKFLQMIENTPELYNAGVEQGINEFSSLNDELEQILYSTDTGGKSFYDEFWESVKAASSCVGLFAGAMWNDLTFKPPFDITLYGSCNYCFVRNGFQGDLVECLNARNVKLIQKNISQAAYMFAWSMFTRIGVLDFSNCSSIIYCFSGTNYLKKIDKIILTETLNLTGAFDTCPALEEIEFDGIIGKALSFANSTKLSKASIENIINCLSTTTSGLTVTFSQEAVTSAFGSTDNSEWINLMNTRKNWTISLA